MALRIEVWRWSLLPKEAEQVIKFPRATELLHVRAVNIRRDSEPFIYLWGRVILESDPVRYEERTIWICRDSPGSSTPCPPDRYIGTVYMQYVGAFHIFASNPRPVPSDKGESP